MSVRYAAFNADTSIVATEANAYYNPTEQSALVLIKISSWNGRPVAKREIVLTGWGSCTETVGNIVSLYADQSGRSMGEYLVVGVVDKGTVTGLVPTTRRRHYVMK